MTTDPVAFTRQFVFRGYFSSEKYRFGFNGQEKVDEVSGEGNHNTAMFWEYDTRLGRRWNVDPKPIPSISYYACFANNPIQNYDILGDSLDAANNDASKNDIKNLTPNNAYIVFEAKENGNVAVKLDFKGLSPDETAKLLKEDAGLSLLNDMCNAPEKMLYEATEVFLGKNDDGSPQATPLYLDNNGLVNASNNGKDSGKGHTSRPKEGYDGQVSISISGQYIVNGVECRKDIVFHELGENYYRTHKTEQFPNGMNYSNFWGYGAHQRSINRSRKENYKFAIDSGYGKYIPSISKKDDINKVFHAISELYINSFNFK